MLLRSAPVVLDLNGVVKGRTVDDALALAGSGWVSAGGDVATAAPLEVGLPGGRLGPARTAAGSRRRASRRAWRARRRATAPPDRPGDRPAGRHSWRDVTVAAGSLPRGRRRREGRAAPRGRRAGVARRAAASPAGSSPPTAPCTATTPGAGSPPASSRHEPDRLVHRALGWDRRLSAALGLGRARRL